MSYGNRCVVLDVEYTRVGREQCGVREDEVMIDWILSYLLRRLRLRSAGRGSDLRGPLNAPDRASPRLRSCSTDLLACSSPPHSRAPLNTHTPSRETCRHRPADVNHQHTPSFPRLAAHSTTRGTHGTPRTEGTCLSLNSTTIGIRDLGFGKPPCRPGSGCRCRAYAASPRSCSRRRRTRTRRSGSRRGGTSSLKVRPVPRCSHCQCLGFRLRRSSGPACSLSLSLA